MPDHDDSTLAYLYGRFDIARRTMKDSGTRPEERRDWAMRAEELRQCLRQLERWRVERTGARYQPDEVTATEIQPPRQAEPSVPAPGRSGVDAAGPAASGSSAPGQRDSGPESDSHVHGASARGGSVHDGPTRPLRHAWSVRHSQSSGRPG